MKQVILSMVILVSLNGFLFAQNPFGLALSLDGDGDQASVPSVQTSNSFTVEAWVNIDTTFSSWRTIYAGGDSGFWLKDKRINWWQGVSDWFLGNDTITSLGWHHVALTYDGYTFNGYLDGILDTISTIMGGGIYQFQQLVLAVIMKSFLMGL